MRSFVPPGFLARRAISRNNADATTRTDYLSVATARIGNSDLERSQHRPFQSNLATALPPESRPFTEFSYIKFDRKQNTSPLAFHLYRNYAISSGLQLNREKSAGADCKPPVLTARKTACHLALWLELVLAALLGPETKRRQQLRFS
jgi:hypothetical protein